ncbi:unnamed protein product [Caretta caretta]
MPVKKKDTDRALALLEEYCKKLKKPEEEQLKKAIKKVMGIFKSSLFQALIGSSSAPVFLSHYMLHQQPAHRDYFPPLQFVTPSVVP